MRLNLGCGYEKMPGWHNVDFEPVCQPDEVWNLETLPWPWLTDSAEEVRLNHVLEHIGAAPSLYLGIIKELYRVCRNGAEVQIAVPHPRHDTFLIDPTHVRPITPGGLEMFSQEANRRWIAQGYSNTPLGVHMGVDFKLVSSKQVLSEPWLGRAQRGEIQMAELEHAASNLNNVVLEYRIVIRAVKPAGSMAPA